MSMNSDAKAHWSFWLIGSAALLWNIAGSVNFLMQMQASSLASMPEPFRTIVANRPGWATAAFGLGVLGGVIGCVLLLLKQRAAIYVFAASLAGIILHLIPYVSPQKLPASFGLGDAVLVFVMPLLVALFLLWYAGRQHVRAP
jgi:hypothetical protein